MIRSSYLQYCCPRTMSYFVENCIYCHKSAHMCLQTSCLTKMMIDIIYHRYCSSVLETYSIQSKLTSESVLLFKKRKKITFLQTITEPQQATQRVDEQSSRVLLEQATVLGNESGLSGKIYSVPIAICRKTKLDLRFLFWSTASLSVDAKQRPLQPVLLTSFSSSHCRKRPFYPVVREQKDPQELWEPPPYWTQSRKN